ncbi:MAG: hypothetical protein M3O31_14045 [Acidobacteriota bacterium]|nr:hypothetical protein [Acidobacteriota bacterium]
MLVRGAAVGDGDPWLVCKLLCMDIHAPDHPILSLKEFFIHILVVTCGILIALGLEGVREMIHDHGLVREARENFRVEMTQNREYGQDEFPRVTKYSQDLKGIVDDLPELEQHPGELNRRLSQVNNPGYFFLANSWQAALSTGALEHMTPDEVTLYGSLAEAVKIYSRLQTEAADQEVLAKTFFRVHPHLTPDQMEQGTERLLLFSQAESSLAYVGPELNKSIEQALKAAGGK